MNNPLPTPPEGWAWPEQQTPAKSEYKWWIPPQRQQPRTGGVQVVEGPNHGLHFALTLFTCGMWLPVWILVALTNDKKVKTYYR